MNLELIRLQSNADERGCLTSVESKREYPFDIKRIFYMHNIVDGEKRGGHAHPDTDQMAIAVSGSVIISTFLDSKTQEFVLDDPTVGLLLPRMTWTELRNFSPSAVCLVLANTLYDPSLVIRDFDEYTERLKTKTLRNLND